MGGVATAPDEAIAPEGPCHLGVVQRLCAAAGGYGLRRSTRVSPHGPADGRSPRPLCSTRGR
jgi:hypothetical protein